MNVKAGKTGSLNFRWKSGNGEILGFAVCSILLVMVVLAVMSFSTYTTQRQQLAVAAYEVGRAAAVSSSEEIAKTRANEVIKGIYQSRLADTAPENGGDVDSGTVWYEMTYDEWKKGELMTVTLYQETGGVFPFGKTTASWSIVMMIEGSIDYTKKNP